MTRRKENVPRQRHNSRCPERATRHRHLAPPPEIDPMKATWNGVTIAESDDTVLVEGNHYFPMSSLNRDVVTFSNHKTTCPWKGSANYYSLLVNGELHADAAWYYPDPKPEAEEIRDRVAFWKDVKVSAQ
jgi:uncharacterized protein (DUF427 family)